MNNRTYDRLEQLEQRAAKQPGATVNLDDLPPDARADFERHYQDGVGDWAAMQDKTLRALLAAMTPDRGDVVQEVLRRKHHDSPKGDI